MRPPERLRRRTYAPPKELDEVGRLAEAELLTDRDRHMSSSRAMAADSSSSKG